MTRAPWSPERAVGGPGDVAAVLREGGGRLSRSRRGVIEALFAAEGPVSAEYIAEGRGDGAQSLELTSVYRTLEHLESLGVVRHVHIGHGPGLYALTPPGDQEYLVCERCDRVTRVESARLDPVRALIRERFGYHVRFSHFPMLGLCAPCARLEDLPGAAEAVPAVRSGPDEHTHERADLAHHHPHTGLDHEQVEHEHEHAHADRVHSHPHAHGRDPEHEHRH